MLLSFLDFHSVVAASYTVAPFVHITPVLTNSYLTSLSGRVSPVLFKVEALQKTGSFKFRGATNAVQSLPAEVAKLGVCTHSSGNHAMALSLAARNRGIEANVVMPETAPRTKRAAVEGYGAKITMCHPEERVSTCSRVAEETGATFIHPSEDFRVIAGQGTVCMEFVQQAKEVSELSEPVPAKRTSRRGSG